MSARARLALDAAKTALAHASDLRVRSEHRGGMRVREDEIRRYLCDLIGRGIAERLYDDMNVRFRVAPAPDGTYDEYQLDLIVMRAADLDELTKAIRMLEWETSIDTAMVIGDGPVPK